jgi:serine/threonine protein kinase
MSTSTWALGSWTIGEKLGEGSAGEVYRASRPGGVQGALKLYHNRDPDFVTRSLSALRQLARVRHPNLTEVLDAAVIEPTGEPVRIPGLTEPGTLYLVSRLVEGRTLEALLEQGPLARGDAIALVAAVGAALDALHRSGLVHRDIKPTNVIVPEVGGPPAAVLVDLGLAGVVDQSTRLTRSGEVFGTPGYMSPEQALGRPQSSASDVWALAALYYRLRFGQAPFEREGVLQTLAAVATEKVRFPDGGAIDPADRQALERALEPDPAKRFPTAQAFVEALRPPAGARPAAPPPAVTQPTASVRARPSPSSPKLASGLLIGGLAVLLLALSAVITTPGAPGWIAPALVGPAAAIGVWLLLSRRAIRKQQQRRVYSGRLQSARRSGRRELTDSLAISMDELLKANRNDPHLKMMGASIRLVIGEYEKARDRDDRRQALEQIIKLIELLDQRAARTSWLERHQKLLAVGTGALALIGTGASQVTGYVLSPVRIDGCPDRSLAGGESYTFSSLLRADPGLADRVWWSVDGVEKKQGGTFTLQIPRPPDRDSYLVKLTAPGVGSASCLIRAAK